MPRAQLNTSGIKSLLKNIDPKQAIAEYVWNGFDANATKVRIDYEVDEMGAVTQIRISDNGHGIDKALLENKFVPVLESDKAFDPDVQKKTSATHGKKGTGRFTFFKLGNTASWNTTYEADGIRQNYTIYIGADTLIDYEASVPKATDKLLGTTVTLSNLKLIVESSFRSEIQDYLARVFCWYLELNKQKSYEIIINGKPLDYSKLVGEREGFVFTSNSFSFDIDYVRWNVFLDNEFSRYYFIDANDEEKVKDTTKLNNQSDKFYHSVFIRSSYFNDLKRPARNNANDESPTDLLGFKSSDKVFRELMQEVLNFLRDKRRPFLESSTKRVLEDLRKQGAFPYYSNNDWDRTRRYQLEQTISSLYQFEPKLFSSLNTEQKKIITRLLDIVLETDEKDRLLEIVSEIINLSKEERQEFADMLQSVKMSSVVKTIRLIQDRMKAVDQIKQLVFDPDLKADEPNHVQKAVENHYWLLGEQYNLVTAAEPKFEEALRRFEFYLRGDDSKQTINHADKNKEMDIFLIRQQIQHNKNKLYCS